MALIHDMILIMIIIIIIINGTHQYHYIPNKRTVVTKVNALLDKPNNSLQPLERPHNWRQKATQCRGARLPLGVVANWDGGRHNGARNALHNHIADRHERH